MPIRSENNKLFHLVSLGCPKNRVDSERIASVMMESGFNITDDPAKADVVIVNTCSFIVPAVEESWRQSSTSARNARMLFWSLPDASHFAMEADWPASCPRLTFSWSPATLWPSRQCLKLRGPSVHVVWGRPSAGSPVIQANRVLSTTGFAYLKVSEGCSRRCAYCTIPAIRGPLESIDLELLLREAEVLADRGVREIVLVAQDLTAYGKDRGDVAALSRLLQGLEHIGGISWIRLMYLHPEGISGDLPGLIKSSDKILPYLDVPFQHVSEPVLRAMGRPWKGERPPKLVERLRREIPGLVLRSTFIVGFPVETKAEFRRLTEFIEETRIEHVGVFTYSGRRGLRQPSWAIRLPRTKEGPSR